MRGLDCVRAVRSYWWTMRQCRSRLRSTDMTYIFGKMRLGSSVRESRQSSAFEPTCMRSCFMFDICNESSLNVDWNKTKLENSEILGTRKVKQKLYGADRCNEPCSLKLRVVCVQCSRQSISSVSAVERLHSTTSFHIRMSGSRGPERSSLAETRGIEPDR